HWNFSNSASALETSSPKMPAKHGHTRKTPKSATKYGAGSRSKKSRKCTIAPMGPLSRDWCVWGKSRQVSLVKAHRDEDDPIQRHFAGCNSSDIDECYLVRSTDEAG